MGARSLIAKNVKSIVGIVLAVLVTISFLCLPDSLGFTFEGKASLGLLFAMIILIIAKSFPLIVIGIALMLSMYFFGIMPYDDIWSSFGNYVLFFVIAMFGIYAAILKTNLPKRIAGLVLRWAKTNSYKVVFGFVFATTLLSMVMSNIPTCMIFCGVAMGLLKGLDNEGIGSRLGKALFIGIPAGSVMGGTACLAGNAMNVVAVGMVQQFTGYEITFASWLCAGFPTAIIMAFIIAATLCLIFKPEKLTQDIVDATIAETQELGKLEVIEKKVIVMLVVLVACWIASSWITWLNTNVVALIGLIIMHFPGVKILEADELCKNTNWDIIVFMGCLMAFMTGFQSSGAASVIVDFALGNASAWSVLAILLAISVVPCIAHICIPSGPAVLLLTMIPLLTAGTALGINPFVIAFIVSVWTGVQFMLPIDGLWMISYGFAYFKTSDLLKWGIFPTVALIILTVTLVPVLVGVFGIGV